MKKYSLIIFFLIFTSLYSRNEEMDTIYFNLNVNNKISDSFHKGIEKDGIKYINLKKFLNLIGMNNNKFTEKNLYLDLGNVYTQEVVIDVDKKEYIKKDKKYKYEGKEISLIDDSIYISESLLMRIFNIKYIKFWEDKLIMDIKLDFKLPHQVNIENDYRRKELKIIEKPIEKTLIGEHLLFQPGNLEFQYDYSKERSGNESKYLDISYTGDLLYGTISTSYSIYPKYKERSTKLIYENIYNNQTLVFGNTNISLPSAINRGNNSITGISFVNSYRSSILRSKDKITFSGYALNGEEVELYRSGNLIGFTSVIDGRYEFKDILVLSYADTYKIKIYNKDGSIEVKEMKNITWDEGLNKLETNYNIYLGKTEYSNKDRFVYDFATGLTNNLTLKYGIYQSTYDLRNKEEYTEKQGRLGFNYISNFKENPYQIKFDSFYNFDNFDSDFNFEILKQFKRITFKSAYEKYDQTSANYLREKENGSFGININPRFILNSINFDYYTYKNIEDYRNEQIRVSAGISFKNFTLDYRIAKDLHQNEKRHDFIIRNYTFKNYYIEFSSVFNNSYSKDYYQLSIHNRVTSNDALSYSLHYSKYSGGEDRISFGIEYKLGDSISLRNNMHKSQGESRSNFSLEVDRILNLKDINQEQFSRIENGWVYGKVFVDYNDNGIYDEGIDIPAISEMRLNGRKVVTDENGDFYFGDYYPQIPVYLSANPKNPMYKSEVSRYLVKGVVASGIEINIPLKPIKMLTGNIIFKDNDLKSNILDKLFIKIYDKETQKEVTNSIPEKDGFFIIENIVSGNYIISLESIENTKPILLQKEIKITNKENIEDIKFIIKKEELSQLEESDDKKQNLYSIEFSYNI